MTVRYEQELYSVEEEAGYVTLALVLEGDTEIPVTVSVNTLDLLHSSVGEAATSELLKVCLGRAFGLYITGAEKGILESELGSRSGQCIYRRLPIVRVVQEIYHYLDSNHASSKSFTPHTSAILKV